MPLSRTLIIGGVAFFLFLGLGYYLIPNSTILLAPEISSTAETFKVGYNGPLVLRFSQPMRRRTEQYITLTPAIEGSFEWLGRHTLLFKPTSSWDIGHIYEVAVHSRAESVFRKSFLKTHSFSFEAVGAPYVHSIIPQTEGRKTLILPNQILTIRFDRPMKSDINNYLKITPPVSGKYDWVNPDTLQFTPNYWPMATAFQLELTSGIAALDGGLTETATVFSLETPEPRVLKVEPHADTLMKIGDPIRLFFNQPMDLNLIQPGNNLQLFPSNDIDSNWRIRRDGFYNVEVTYGKDSDGKEDQSILVLIPTFPYQYHRDYRLVLKKGLKGLAAALGEPYGHLGLADDFEWRFRTVSR